MLARELDSADDPAAVLVWRTQRLAEQLGAPLPPTVDSAVDPSARLVTRRADGRVVAVTGGEPRYCTPELLAVEQHAVEVALAGRGAVTPRVEAAAVAGSATAGLSGEQAAMVTRLVTGVGRGYAIGDQVVCTRNQHRLGVLNGTRATVTAADPHRQTLTVTTHAGRHVTLPRWYLDAGHVAHGYALTDHKAQGLTVAATWILATGPALYRQWLYTALTRHRDTARLYLADHDLTALDDQTEVHPRAREARDVDPVADLQRRAAHSRAHQLALETGTPAAQPDPARRRGRPARTAQAPAATQLRLAL